MDELLQEFEKQIQETGNKDDKLTQQRKHGLKMDDDRGSATNRSDVIGQIEGFMKIRKN